eukprot:COSAG01_NODE_5877_length_3973_cov_2.627001_3_plen_77_part_00
MSYNQLTESGAKSLLLGLTSNITITSITVATRDDEFEEVVEAINERCSSNQTETLAALLAQLNCSQPEMSHNEFSS